jgi:hypothetical protein
MYSKTVPSGYRAMSLARLGALCLGVDDVMGGAGTRGAAARRQGRKGGGGGVR